MFIFDNVLQKHLPLLEGKVFIWYEPQICQLQKWDYATCISYKWKMILGPTTKTQHLFFSGKKNSFHYKPEIGRNTEFLYADYLAR